LELNYTYDFAIKEPLISTAITSDDPSERLESLGFAPIGWDESYRIIVQNNPVNFVDPKGLLSEVIVLQPVGWGSSSFGHIATNINGTAYSYGPDGMSTMQTSDYLNRNSFRDGVGAELNLTPDQEARLQACMAGNQGDYGKVTNNCTSPIQRCLKDLGIDLGWNMLPVSLGNSLMDSGLVTKYNFYPATTPATGSSAPWAK
jgi:hypothetical protein